MKRFILLAILGCFLLPSSTLAQRPHNAKKLVERGIELFSKGEIAAAIAEYDRALALDPKLPEAFLNRGKAKRAFGDLDGSIVDFEAVIELAPRLAANNRDITQAYLNRGYIRSNQLDVDGALSDYDRAIRFDPNDADAYFKRGRAFLIDGNLQLAIADFDKSISLDAHNPLVYAERGFAHQSRGQNEQAQKDFERGLKLNNNLRLMLDLHLLDLQVQIREMKRRQAAIQRNIARLIWDNPPDDESRRRAPVV